MGTGAFELSDIDAQSQPAAASGKGRFRISDISETNPRGVTEETAVSRNLQSDADLPPSPAAAEQVSAVWQQQKRQIADKELARVTSSNKTGLSAQAPSWMLPKMGTPTEMSPAKAEFSRNVEQRRGPDLKLTPKRQQPTGLRKGADSPFSMEQQAKPVSVTEATAIDGSERELIPVAPQVSLSSPELPHQRVETIAEKNIREHEELPLTPFEQQIKTRFFEPVSMAEVEKIPGLQPESVAQLESQGDDVLGSVFAARDNALAKISRGERPDATELAALAWVGRANEAQARKQLRGFTPEVAARGAAKSITDWYSPFQMLLRMPGLGAMRASRAAGVATKAGDLERAAEMASQARMYGAIGATPGVPMVASQAQELHENWDLMTPQERSAAIAGITGGAVLTGLGAVAVANPHINAASTPDGKVAGISALNDRVAVGVAKTPEGEIRIGGRIGNRAGSIPIRRGQQPAGPALEQPTIQGEVVQPSAAQADAVTAMRDSIQAVARAQAADRIAVSIATGKLPVEPTSEPVPEPQVPPITDELLGTISSAIMENQPAARGQLIAEAHGQLSKGLLQQGKVFLGGRLHIIENEQQASKLAQETINSEIERADREAAAAVGDNESLAEQSGSIRKGHRVLFLDREGNQKTGTVKYFGELAARIKGDDGRNYEIAASSVRGVLGDVATPIEPSSPDQDEHAATAQALAKADLIDVDERNSRVKGVPLDRMRHPENGSIVNFEVREHPGVTLSAYVSELDTPEKAARVAVQKLQDKGLRVPEALAKRAGIEITEIPSAGSSGQMHKRDIAVAPHILQYKLLTDAEGVGTALRDVERFNPVLGGRLSVYQAQAQDVQHGLVPGKVYVVNGHHRLGLANRDPGTDRLDVHHIKAKDAIEARATGALQNIAEGKGTAIDAAKFLRDSGYSLDRLRRMGISMTEAIARNGIALAKLDPAIFNSVVQGGVPEGRAVAIGEATDDHAEQRAILDLIEKREAKGRHVTNETLRELIRFVRGSGRTTESTPSLFGEETVTRSLALEEAEVSAYVKQQIAKDRRLFSTLSKSDNAVRVEKSEAGKIDVDRSKDVATSAIQAEEVYEKLSTREGSIRQVLRSAAQRLAQGENPDAAKREAYREIRAEISRTLGGSPREDVAGTRATEGARAGTAAEEGRRAINATPSGTPGAPLTAAERVRAAVVRNKSNQAVPGTPESLLRMLDIPEDPSPEWEQATARDMQHWYVPGQGRVPAYIELNREAAVFLNYMMAGRFSGITLSPGMAEAVSNALLQYATIIRKEALAAALNLRKLARSIQQAAQENGHAGVPIVTFLQNRVITTAEELFHSALQYRPAKGTGIENGVPFEQLKDHPVFQKMWISITNEHGVLKPAEVLAEAIFDCWSGEYLRWGVTDEEAAELIEAYFTLVPDEVLADETALRRHITDQFGNQLGGFDVAREAIERVQARRAEESQTGPAKGSLSSNQERTNQTHAAARSTNAGDRQRSPAGKGASPVIPRQAQTGIGREAERNSPEEANVPTLASAARIESPSGQQYGLSRARSGYGGGVDDLQQFVNAAGQHLTVIPSGEQQTLFGQPEPVYKLLNQKTGESTLVSQSQLDRLRTEPSAQPALDQGALFRRVDDTEQDVTFGMSVPLPSARKEFKAFWDHDIAPLFGREGIRVRDIGRLFLQGFFPRAEETSLIARKLGVGASRDAVDAIMQMKGDRDQLLAKFDLAAKRIESMFDKLPGSERIAFIDRIMEGKRQPNPQMQEIADALTDAVSGVRSEEKKWGTRIDPNTGLSKTFEDRPNYFPLRWDVIPGSGMEKSAGLHDVTRLQGNRSFAKRKMFKTASEGISAGGRLVTTNPVRLMRIRLEEGVKYVTAHRMWNEMKELGLLKYIKRTEPTPDGWADIEDSIAQTYFPVEVLKTDIRRYVQDRPSLRVGPEKQPVVFADDIETRRQMMDGGRWVAEANAARMINNYLSRDKVRTGKWAVIGRPAMALKNMSTALELGLSPFHAVFETIEANSSQMSMGMLKLWNQGLRQGNGLAALDGLKDIATSPAAFIQWAHDGAAVPAYIAIRQEMHQLGSKAEGSLVRKFLEMRREKNVQRTLKKYPDLDHMVDMMFAGGMIIGQHRDYQVKTLQTIRENWSAGNHIGAVLRAVPNAMQVVMKPLFEWYIPNLKYAMFMKQFSQQRTEKSAELDSGKLTEVELARQVVDSVENRFGEMNFDNLFWDRTLKTTLQFVFRSVTWKLGNVREMGGALMSETKDIAEWLHALKEYQPQGNEGQVPPKRTVGEKALPRLNMKASWFLSLMLTTGIMGTIATKLLSGRYPWEWAQDEAEDFSDFVSRLYLETVHPRTGDYDFRGKPSRLSMPTYWKDVEHFKKDPWRTISGSFSTTLSRTIDVAKNEDFQGNYVYNPNASFLTRQMQKAKYSFPTPFIFSNFERAKEQGDNRSGWFSAFGFTPASSDTDWSSAESRMVDLLRSRKVPFTPEQVEEFRENRRAIEEGTASPRQMRNALKSMNTPWMVKLFKSLKYEEALDVYYNYATPDEQAALKPYLDRKRAAAFLRDPGRVETAERESVR